MVFCKQWGHYHQERIGAKSQRHSLVPLVMKILKQCYWLNLLYHFKYLMVFCKQ